MYVFPLGLDIGIVIGAEHRQALPLFGELLPIHHLRHVPPWHLNNRYRSSHTSWISHANIVCTFYVGCHYWLHRQPVHVLQTLGFAVSHMATGNSVHIHRQSRAHLNLMADVLACHGSVVDVLVCHSCVVYVLVRHSYVGDYPYCPKARYNFVL